MKPILLAFLGRAGSGKSTAANYVVETFGATRLSFAKPLKELTKRVFDFTDEQVYGTTAQKETIDPRYGISPRTALIRIGDGAREVVDKDIWVRPVLDTVARAGKQIFVLDDARYMSECKQIYESAGFHGHVIKLICPDSDSSGYATAPSEKSVDEVPELLLSAIITSMKSPGSIDLKNKVFVTVEKLIKDCWGSNPAFWDETRVGKSVVGDVPRPGEIGWRESGRYNEDGSEKA